MLTAGTCVGFVHTGPDEEYDSSHPFSTGLVVDVTVSRYVVGTNPVVFAAV